ncbi:hypothetical protein PG993_013332 [Apiospora rasikravindrae]|uniref:Uncharacterized protein n=1 Tax=Apiospora rasikravindrae TaxID=990691 RepID=A0ABR1RYQ7_9PEZI
MPHRQQQQNHPPHHSGSSFQARLERKERMRIFIYRHQATITFLFTLAALAQSLGSLIYLATCRCYPVPPRPLPGRQRPLRGPLVRLRPVLDPEPAPRRLFAPGAVPAPVVAAGNYGDPRAPEETHMMVRHPEPAEIEGWGLAVPKAKHE